MIDTNTNSPQANYEPSDEQIDKFFASGGQEGLDVAEEPAPAEEVVEATPPAQEEVTQATKDLTDEELNYKSMAREERERRKELQQELQETRVRTQKMEEAFQKMMEQSKSPQQAEPSFDEDPLAALKYKQEHLERLQNQQAAIEQQRAQYEQVNARNNQFINQYQNDAHSFANNNPDFAEAYQHLVVSELNELKAIGWNEQDSHKILVNKERAIAEKAYADGVNPAQRMYELAKFRGFNKAQPAPAAKAASKFDQVEKVLDNSKSLSESAGGSVSKGISLEALSEMDEEEFDKNWSKLAKIMR